jgi:hypothetical protein
MKKEHDSSLPFMITNNSNNRSNSFQKIIINSNSSNIKKNISQVLLINLKLIIKKKSIHIISIPDIMILTLLPKKINIIKLTKWKKIIYLLAWLNKYHLSKKNNSILLRKNWINIAISLKWPIIIFLQICSNNNKISLIIKYAYNRHSLNILKKNNIVQMTLWTMAVVLISFP